MFERFAKYRKWKLRHVISIVFPLFCSLQETNTFKGVVIKYSEPPEARKPKRRWRFYVFKVSFSLVIRIKYSELPEARKPKRRWRFYVFEVSFSIVIRIKYSESPEARKPKRRWRFFVFKVSLVLLFASNTASHQRPKNPRGAGVFTFSRWVFCRGHCPCYLRQCCVSPRGEVKYNKYR